MVDIHRGLHGEAVLRPAGVDQNHEPDLVRILLLHTVVTTAVEHHQILHLAILTTVQVSVYMKMHKL